MSRRVVVLGAYSDIAEATCRLYAAEGAKMVLAGRDAERLARVADDLRVRGAAQVEIEPIDLVAGAEDAEALIAKWAGQLGGLDLVLLAYGVLGEQRALERDLAAAAALIDTNFRSAALWCLAAANHLEHAKSGSLVVIGSVASPTLSTAPPRAASASSSRGSPIASPRPGRGRCWSSPASSTPR
jgi:decaprenylphospho-beta-D-erythro-pentofuranosid-2-ulose 2-reductase